MKLTAHVYDLSRLAHLWQKVSPLLVGSSLATIDVEQRRTVCFSARVLVDNLEVGSCSVLCKKNVAKIQMSCHR